MDRDPRVVDVSYRGGTGAETYSFELPVVDDPADENDHLFRIRASVIDRCRSWASEIVSDSGFDFSELALAGASFCFGFTVSSYVAGVTFSLWKGFFAYALSPALGIGLLVYYVMHKRASKKSSADSAQNILEMLPKSRVPDPKER